MAKFHQMKISAPKEPKIPVPSKVGGQLKSSHFNAVHLKNHLAWYVALNSKPQEENICCIPQIKWKCPPTFTLNPVWNIFAGEGSQEAASQKFRETTALEVVYPHLSAIPPNSCSPTNIKDENCDNSLIPIIPIIPVEEVMAGSESLSDASAPIGRIDPQPLATAKSVLVSRNLLISQSSTSGPLDQDDNDKCLPEVLSGLESGDLEVAAAAAATVAAVMESKEQIDTELLIKLLADPEMVKKLIDGHGLRHGNPPTPELRASLKPGSVDKMVNDCSELVAASIHSNSRPKIVNPSLALACSKAEKAPVKPASGPYSRCDGISRPLCKSRATKRSSGIQRSVADVHSPRGPGVSLASIAFCRPDEEINRLIKQYRPPDIASVPPPNPPTSAPNMEAIRKLISEYGVPVVKKNMINAVAPDHGWGSNSSSTASETSRNFTSTGTTLFAPFPKLTTIAPPMEFKEHGQPANHMQGLEFAHLNTSLIETNPKYQRPCMYFNSAKGCWKASNCPYQHHYDVSKQWKMELTGTKRIKFTGPEWNFN